MTATQIRQGKNYKKLTKVSPQANEERAVPMPGCLKSLAFF